MSGPGKARAMGVPALRSTEGLGPTPASRGVWLSGPAAGAEWSGDPVGLVLGQLASVLAPVFHLPSSDSLSAGFHVPGWEHRGVWKDAAGSGPLSLPAGGQLQLARALAVASLSSQLSWWLQLPGSASFTLSFLPPLIPPRLRADHGS